MNISSVSSSSILWEEYLKKLKEQGRGTAAEGINLEAASQKQDISPEALLAELEGLQSDPDALKARASEMAAEVSAAAEDCVDARGDILKEFAADLETVASGGDLSAIREKLPRRGPSGGPSGLNGAASVSASSLQAMLAEEEAEEDDETSVSNIDRIKELLSELQELIAGMDGEAEDAGASESNSDLAPGKLLAELEALEGDPEKLKARAAEMAEQASAAAENRTARFSRALEELASDLEAVSESGDLSVIREKLERGRSGRMGAAGDAPASPSAIFSRYQSLLESAGVASSNSADVIGDAEDDDQLSVNDVIESVRSNLSNRLSQLYSQSRVASPSISMSA